MAKGATLSEMISELREELRRANSPSASPDDTPSLRRTINHVLTVIFASNDWPFLNTLFDPITLNAGQRWYDMPANLDFDRIIEARVWWGGLSNPIERGITLDDYNAYNPLTNQRAFPIEKWDVRFTDSAAQIEVWPLPDGGAQTLQFYGTRKAPRLVNEADVCPIESEIVVLYAAAELLPKDSPDKEPKLLLAKELLRLSKVRNNSAGGKVYRMGVDGNSDRPAPRSSVHVSG